MTMKEFISAVEDVADQDTKEERIKALMEGVKSSDGSGWEKQPMSREDAEHIVYEDKYVEFKLDGRTLRAYHPHDGQLTFMLAALGRGQTADQRYAAIVNIMMETLRGSDQDYLEGRLLTKDRTRRLPLSQVEAIFEYLTEQWFRPDVPGDGAAVSDSR